MAISMWETFTFTLISYKHCHQKYLSITFAHQESCFSPRLVISSDQCERNLKTGCKQSVSLISNTRASLLLLLLRTMLGLSSYLCG